MADPRDQVLRALTAGPRTAWALREALEIPTTGWRRFRQTVLKGMLAEGVITTIGQKKGIEYALSQDKMRALATAAERKSERTLSLVRARWKDQRIKKLTVELEEARAALARANGDLEFFVGPGHTPPVGVEEQTWTVARPPIKGFFWEVGPWKCLRLAERTVGHHRESAYLRQDTGRPALRFHPETEKWMKWITGIFAELRLVPTTNQVRVIFFPGLSYTFMAWREVEERLVVDLHPMDPDNAFKPIADAAQSISLGKDREFGAWRNDTQIVDLLVYRLPQDDRAPVDRLALSRELRAKRKPRVKKPRPKPQARPSKATSRFRISKDELMNRLGLRQGEGEGEGPPAGDRTD